MQNTCNVNSYSSSLLKVLGTIVNVYGYDDSSNSVSATTLTDCV